MATLTSDKLASIKMEFSIKDLVYYGSGRSTPKQIVHLGGFAPPKKAA
jgi:hypothetical protein